MKLRMNINCNYCLTYLLASSPPTSPAPTCVLRFPQAPLPTKTPLITWSSRQPPRHSAFSTTKICVTDALHT